MCTALLCSNQSVCRLCTAGFPGVALGLSVESGSAVLGFGGGIIGAFALRVRQSATGVRSFWCCGAKNRLYRQRPSCSLVLSKGACQFQAVFFGVCEEDFAFKVGEQVDLAVTLDNNEYDGRSYLSVVIRDMRPTGIDDQKTAAELTAYHDFCSGLAGQYDFLMPDRTAFAAVYKCLQGQPLTKSWLCNRFSVSVGYGKTAVICDALIQLGLLTVNDHGRLCVHAGGQKVDLMTAPILERLNGQGR